MEILIVVLFVLFMFLVDWRLNKIHKELRQLNVTAERHLASLSLPARTLQQPQVAPETPLSEASLMAKYGITKEGDKYVYSGYRYDKLQDAVTYASSKVVARTT